jgi:hypothetical protein
MVVILTIVGAQMSAPIDLAHPFGGMSPLNNFCRRNHVGRSFVYEQIRDGKLIAVKVGARTYITYEAEHAWRSALPKLTPGPVARLSKTRPSPSSVRVA